MIQNRKTPDVRFTSLNWVISSSLFLNPHRDKWQNSTITNSYYLLFSFSTAASLSAAPALASNWKIIAVEGVERDFWVAEDVLQRAGWFMTYNTYNNLQFYYICHTIPYHTIPNHQYHGICLTMYTIYIIYPLPILAHVIQWQVGTQHHFFHPFLADDLQSTFFRQRPWPLIIKPWLRATASSLLCVSCVIVQCLSPRYKKKHLWTVSQLKVPLVGHTG